MPPKRFAFVVGMAAIGMARVATLTPMGSFVFHRETCTVEEPAGRAAARMVVEADRAKNAR